MKFLQHAVHRNVVPCWLTVFLCSSSKFSNAFNSYSLSHIVTICPYVPLSKKPILSFHSGIWIFGKFERIINGLGSYSKSFFWKSLNCNHKWNNFCFTGLKSIFWKLCFAVAVSRGFNVCPDNCKNFSHIHSDSLLMFLIVWEALSGMRERIFFCHIWSSDSVYWGLSGRDLDWKSAFFFIFRQRWALLWLVKLAVWRFCLWCC